MGRSERLTPLQRAALKALSTTVAGRMLTQDLRRELVMTPASFNRTVTLLSQRGLVNTTRHAVLLTGAGREAVR